MIIWMIKAHPTRNRMARQATTEFALSEPRFPSRGQGNGKPVTGEAATLHYGVMSTREPSDGLTCPLLTMGQAAVTKKREESVCMTDALNDASPWR
jgi:hypothetical protein